MLLGQTEESYRDFATYAAGSSPCFEQWALGVAGDEQVLAWLESLPEPKRQPNLVFAAARWHGLAAPAPYAELRTALLHDDGRIRATILERATQTNEVGRLATLLPAFHLLAGDRPIALLEVGASAGLCLYPDRWSYRWTTPPGEVRLAGPPRELTADVTGPAPLPGALPRVVWRGGIDLNPLDVTDADDARWLTTLVWPEHEDRRLRLTEAIEVVRDEPPPISQGDLLEELPGRIEQVRALGDEVVAIVFHSAVIAYLDDADRRRFTGLMAELVARGVHWVSNEGPSVLPSVTGSATVPPGRFVLGIDGRAVGYTEGHGRSLHWW